MLHTPTVLGSAVLGQPLPDPVSAAGPAPIFVYNGLHLLAFLAVGFTSAWLVREAVAVPVLDAFPTGSVVWANLAAAAGIVTDSDFSAKPARIPFSTFQSRKLLGEWLDKQNAEEVYDEARTLAVEEIMSTPLHSVELDDPLNCILVIMFAHDVKHVPVLDEGARPVGMVARHDLLKMLASSRGLTAR